MEPDGAPVWGPAAPITAPPYAKCCGMPTMALNIPGGVRSGSSFSSDVSRSSALRSTGGAMPCCWCIALTRWRRFWNHTRTERVGMSSRCESSLSRACRGMGVVVKMCSSI